MSTDQEASDGQDDAPRDGGALGDLEQQIVDRMAQLYVAAEEYYKLQVLLDTIDGRDRLPTPEYLVPLLPEPEPIDEQQRLEAQRRLAERIGRLRSRRRRAPDRR